MTDYTMPDFVGSPHAAELPDRVDNTVVNTNPLLRYCADPNLVVFDGKYHLYCTDDGISDWGSTQLSVYVSEDLCTWERHRILQGSDIPWWRGDAGLWAPSILRRRDGVYVLYFVADSQIGVAMAPTPAGPFVATNSPIVAADEFEGRNIDPSVFTRDGQRYFLWGNGVAHMVPLDDDCLGFDMGLIESWVPQDFREALWMHERNGIYYESWSCNDTRDPGYRIQYAMSDSPFGPWGETRTLVEQDVDKKIYATGHHSIVNIPGTDEWIIAYHRFAYGDGGDGFHRETVFAPLNYSPDGTIKQVCPQVGSYVRSLAF
jgi:beta-xylosidase